MLMANARMAALKAKDNSACSRASLRIGREVMVTSAVCAATASVNAKWRKSL